MSLICHLILNLGIHAEYGAQSSAYHLHNSAHCYCFYVQSGMEDDLMIQMGSDWFQLSCGHTLLKHLWSVWSWILITRISWYFWSKGEISFQACFGEKKVGKWSGSSARGYSHRQVESIRVWVRIKRHKTLHGKSLMFLHTEWSIKRRIFISEEQGIS